MDCLQNLGSNPVNPLFSGPEIIALVEPPSGRRPGRSIDPPRATIFLPAHGCRWTCHRTIHTEQISLARPSSPRPLGHPRSNCGAPVQRPTMTHPTVRQIRSYWQTGVSQQPCQVTKKERRMPPVGQRTTKSIQEYSRNSSRLVA